MTIWLWMLQVKNLVFKARVFLGQQALEKRFVKMPYSGSRWYDHSDRLYKRRKWLHECSIRPDEKVDVQWNPDITIFDVTTIDPGQCYGKIYEMKWTKPRFNNPRYNDIPGKTITIQLSKRKIKPDITIKSIITQPERNGRHFKRHFLFCLSTVRLWQFISIVYVVSSERL